MTEILQTPKLVVVFGGSGFVGRHVVRALAKRGYRIRVACRRPDLAGHLQPLGNVGQIQPVQANLRVRWSVDRAVQGADHVASIWSASCMRAARRTSTRCRLRRRRRRRSGRAPSARGMVHVSAIGADENSPSRLRPHQGGAAKRRCWRPSPTADHPAAVDRFRPGGRVHQPLRRHGARSRRCCR